MAVASGTAGSVLYNSGGTVRVEKVMEWNHTINSTINEVTGMGETWQSNVGGLKSLSGNIITHGDPAAGNQGSIQTEILTGAGTVGLLLYENETKYWTVTARLGEQSTGITIDGTLGKSWAWTGDGTPTYT